MARPTATWRSSVFSTSNSASPYTATTAWTPAANSLIVAFVCNTATSPADPTGVTAHGVTLDKVRGGLVVNTNNNISVWVGNAGASPTNAAASASVGGTPTGCSVVEFEVTNWASGGTALAAVLLTATATGASGTTGTVNIPLDAQTVDESAWLSFFNHIANETTTGQGGNWTATAGGTGNYTSTASGSCGQHNNTGYTATATATWATSSAWLGLVIEIQGTTADEPLETVKIADSVTVSLNPLNAPLATEPLKLADTVTVLLNPLRAEPAVETGRLADSLTPPVLGSGNLGVTVPAEVVTVGASGKIDLYGLGATVKVQDTVTAVLVAGLVATVTPEAGRLAAAGEVELLGPGAALHIQDTVTAQLVSSGGDLSVVVVSDALKVQDTVTVAGTLSVVVVSDALKVQDTVTVAGNLLSVAVTAEALHAVDAEDANWAEFVSFEAVTVADTVTAFLNPLQTTPASESLKVADTVTPALQLAVVLADEPLKIADTITALLNPLQTATVAESLKVADTATGVESPLQTSLVESLPVQDTVLALENPLRAAPAVDTLHLTDSVSGSPVGGLAVNVTPESILLNEDQPENYVELFTDEGVRITDTVTAALFGGLQAMVTETLHVTDLVTVSPAVAATETLRLGDTVTVVLTPLQAAPALESSGVLDLVASIVLTPLLSTPSAESLKVQDAVTATITGSNILTATVTPDGLKVQDAPTVLENPLVAAPALEALTVADTGVAVLTPLQTSTQPAEAMTVHDTVTAALQVGTVVTEALKVVDSVSVLLIGGTLTVSVSDETLHLGDTLTGVLTPLVVALPVEALRAADQVLAGTDLLAVVVASEGVRVQDTLTARANIAEAYADVEFLEATSVDLYVTVT